MFVVVCVCVCFVCGVGLCVVMIKTVAEFVCVCVNLVWSAGVDNTNGEGETVNRENEFV